MCSSDLLVKEIEQVEGQALVGLPKIKNKPTGKRLARIVFWVE